MWLVEDSPLAARHALGVLGALYEVTCFGDGEAMIERIADGTQRPDLLVTDWELPGVSGLDVLRFVRERYDEISLPVLMVTGIAADEGMSFAEPFAAGVNDYLRKPYSDLELLARVRTLLRVGQQAQRIAAAAEFEKQLIGIVSHDLLNPVTSMTVGAQALLRRDMLDEQSTAIAARIKSSGDRCARMIKDLLDFTRARLGGGIGVVTKVLDGHALAREVLDEVQLNHLARQFRLVGQGETRAKWDADRIAQVVTNLVVNALKYGSREGAITVTIDGTSEQWITLSVHNDGPAIDVATRQRLFEPMQRGETAAEDLRTSSGGADRRSVGLGLFIVKNIVEAHGGTILLHSEEGAGTTFSARLPRMAA